MAFTESVFFRICIIRQTQEFTVENLVQNHILALINIYAFMVKSHLLEIQGLVVYQRGCGFLWRQPRHNLVIDYLRNKFISLSELFILTGQMRVIQASEENPDHPGTEVLLSCCCHPLATTCIPTIKDSSPHVCIMVCGKQKRAKRRLYLFSSDLD